MSETADEQTADLCGIDGLPHDNITKGEFNRFARTVRYYHVRPIKQSLDRLEKLIEEQSEIMQSHIDSDREFFAKLAGAKWAIYGIFAILAFAGPVIYGLLRALFIAKVL